MLEVQGNSAAISDGLRRALGSRAFLEAVPVGIYCCDRDGVIWVYNRRAAGIWGTAPTIGDTERRFCGSFKLHTTDGQPLPHDQTPMAEVLATGRAVNNARVVIERPDGTRLTALVNIEPLFDDAGTQIGAVNSFQDISELVAAESRAREQQRDLRQMFDALPAAVYTTDAEGRINFYNEAAVDFSGRRPALGDDSWCVSWKLYWPDGTPMPHEQCPMASAIKERRAIRGKQAIAERPDGSRIRFLACPTPLFGADGQLTGAINMLVDITELHEAQVELAHLAAIVECSDDAIVSKTLDGVIRSWNAGATRIYGYTADEMIGQPILRIIPPDLQHEEDEILSRLSRGERVEHFETARIAKDGRRVDVSITVSPLRDANGTIVGASKVARDVSERKQADRRLQLLLHELNHRVKNTLATVQAVANQMVRQDLSPAAFAASFCGRIKSLSKAHELLTDHAWEGAGIVEIMRSQLLVDGENDRISMSGPSVHLDAQASQHLALVLHEMGTNARKHGALSVPGGKVAVNWTLRSNGARVLDLVWTEQNGPRIQPPQRRGFGTTLIENSLAPYGGEARLDFLVTGLVCRIRMQLPGAGTGPREAAATTAEPAAAPLPPARTALDGKRVLVVEDEPLVAMDLEAALAGAGCDVVGVAATLAKAKELVDTELIDVALLDGNLGGQPVDAVAEALTRRGIPFAFVTGYARSALPGGYADAPVITKPFSHDDLIATVATLGIDRPTTSPTRLERRSA